MDELRMDTNRKNGSQPGVPNHEATGTNPQAPSTQNPLSTKWPKAVCYVRVGPGEQDIEGLSIDDQTERLQAYCTEHELDSMLVVRDDQVPGTQPFANRLGGGDLIRIIATAGVQHIVILKLDRVFRNAIDALEQTQGWISDGLALHVVDAGGQSMRSDGEIGVYFLGMITGFAELEHTLASERTRTAIALKKANHFVYGSTPYGYDPDGNQLVTNADEQKVIQRVKSWRAEGWSLRRIARELNDNGIPTKQAHPSKPATRWYASTVRYLLSNPLHHGGEEEA